MRFILAGKGRLQVQSILPKFLAPCLALWKSVWSVNAVCVYLIDFKNSWNKKAIFAPSFLPFLFHRLSCKWPRISSHTSVGKPSLSGAVRQQYEGQRGGTQGDRGGGGEAFLSKTPRITEHPWWVGRQNATTDGLHSSPSSETTLSLSLSSSVSQLSVCKTGVIVAE